MPNAERQLLGLESRQVTVRDGSVAGAQEVAVDDRSVSQSCLSSRKVSYPFLSGRTATNPVASIPANVQAPGRGLLHPHDRIGARMPIPRIPLARTRLEREAGPVLWTLPRG